MDSRSGKGVGVQEVSLGSFTEEGGVSKISGAVAYGARNIEEDSSGRSAVGTEDGSEEKAAGERAYSEDAKLMGYIFWCSVASSRLTREELEEVFAEAALDEELLPGEISPRDAFRRAAKFAERRAKGLVEYLEGETDPRGSAGEEYEEAPRARVMVREVKAAGGREVRHVVREVVDGIGEHLEYRTVGSLSVEEGSLSIDLQVSREELTVPEATIVDSFSEYFEHELLHYDAYAMRRIVRHALSRCSPVTLNKQGGVYVVPRSRGRELAALERFVSGLRRRSGPGGATVWRVPLVDDSDYREQIEESLAEQVLAERDALISEMRHALGERGRMTEARKDGFIERWRKLRALVDDYREALEEESLELDGDLDIASRQIQSLLSDEEHSERGA